MEKRKFTIAGREYWFAKNEIQEEFGCDADEVEEFWSGGSTEFDINVFSLRQAWEKLKETTPPKLAFQKEYDAVMKALDQFMVAMYG